MDALAVLNAIPRSGSLLATPYCFRRRGREIDFGGFGDFLLVLHREVGLRFIPEHHRRQVGGEGAHRHVVLLHRLDVAVPRDRDPVLGPFELCLQIAEVGVGFQLRIVLRHHQQPGKGSRQLSLGGLELRERLGVVDQLRGRLDAADLGAGIGDPQQHILFLGGKPLYGVHQVGNQVRAALVLVQDLGPARLDQLIVPLKCVVAAAGNGETPRNTVRTANDFRMSSPLVSGVSDRRGNIPSAVAASRAKKSYPGLCTNSPVNEKPGHCTGVTGLISRPFPLQETACRVTLPTLGGNPSRSGCGPRFRRARSRTSASMG